LRDPRQGAVPDFFCSIPPEAFFRPDRVSTPPSRADAVKAGRASAATEGLALAASSTVACSGVRADNTCRVGPKFPPDHRSLRGRGLPPPQHGIRRLQGPMSLAHCHIRDDGMQAAPRASCSLVPAGTRTSAGCGVRDQRNLMPRKLLQPALQSRTFRRKATYDA
jgi:hypothetical protein